MHSLQSKSVVNSAKRQPSPKNSQTSLPNLSSHRHPKKSEYQSMMSTKLENASPTTGRNFVKDPYGTNENENFKIANSMNVNSHDIFSLFKEMDLAVRRVLRHNLSSVNYIMIDSEIIGALLESEYSKSFLIRPIQIENLDGYLVQLKQGDQIEIIRRSTGQLKRSSESQDLQAIMFNSFSPAITNLELLKFGPVYRNNSVVMPIKLKQAK